MQKVLVFTLLVSILLLAPAPASAGTAANPEITDLTRDVDIFADSRDPNCGSDCLNERRAHLDVTKAWIEPRGGQFHFTIQVRDMREVIDIPKDSVYIFHYTWEDTRFYWRANWSADRSEFQYMGGLYAGCKPPVCPSHDLEGNKQYAYLPGNTSQREHLEGVVTPGSPGQITWKYPLDAFGELRDGLTFKGLFVITYQRGEQNELRYIDTAQSQRDYEHQIYTPWWAQFVPGPTPALVAVAALVLVAAARRTRGGA